MKVYLAGPIAGCNRGEANDWRAWVSSKLRPHGIRGISPLRCEPLVGERYGLGGNDPMFGTARAIASKNMMDVQMCDATLAYLPHQASRPVSLGTVLEIGWASILRKPVILVTDDPYAAAHPVVNACAGWLLGDMEQAVELLVGLLGDYAKKETV